MRAVLLEVPQALLDERRRTGADLRDEMWQGVLHMVPPPSEAHMRLSAGLFRALAPLAEARGLVPYFETGLFAPGRDDDWRVPDQVYARPEQVSERGVEGAVPLVVEIRSPGDETDLKLPWYAGPGVAEVLVIDPATRAVELFVLHSGELVPAAATGGVEVSAVGARLRPATGPVLVVKWDGGSVGL